MLCFANMWEMNKEASLEELSILEVRMNTVKGAKGGLAATSKRCKGAVAVPNCVLKVQRGE